MKPVSTISVIGEYWYYQHVPGKSILSLQRVKYSQGQLERLESLDDGYHIALLILANLYRICPQFLRENRVYWLRCPLHIAYDKNMQPLSWYYTDEELAAAKANGKIKGDLDRIKGLGQLEEADLKATMFSKTGGQKMEQIIYSEEAAQRLCELMGVDIKPRKEFVMSRIDFSKYNNV